MIEELLNSASEKGAVETLIDLLKKQNLTEEQAYFILSLACVELTH